MNLILAFFRGPSWVQFLLAVAVAALGYFVQIEEGARQLRRADLLAQDPPATVPIDASKGKPVSRDLQEVSVSAQLGLDHNTRLVRKTNGVETSETMLYVLFSPDAPAGETVVQGAIVLDPEEIDAFAEWVSGRTTGFGANGPIVTIAGLRTMSAQASHARDAMDDNGLSRANGFFFIEPFVGGRAAALAADPAAASTLSLPVYGAAAVLALIGAAKFAMQAKRGVPPDAPARLTSTAPSAVPPAVRARRGLAGKVLVLVVVVFAGAVSLGYYDIVFALPLVIIGAMIWGIGRAFRTIGQTIGQTIGRAAVAATDHVAAPASAVPAVAVGVPSLPIWAMVQKTGAPAPAAPAPVAAVPAPAPAAAPKSPSPIRSAGGDRFADSAIQPGFTLSGLFGRLAPSHGPSKARRADPFDRLTRMVEAEQRRG